MGERTFEIKSWGTKDGYSTATVNWLESTDTAETEEEAAECARKVCQNLFMILIQNVIKISPLSFEKSARPWLRRGGAVTSRPSTLKSDPCRARQGRKSMVFDFILHLHLYG